MRQKLKQLLFNSIISLPFVSAAQGPYPPAAGQVGTTAIHKDSSVFMAWASNANVILGYQDIANQSLGLTNTGTLSNVYGPADGTVISLGDSGVVTFILDNFLMDDNGPDFAIFENSFSNNFLELARVQVSSDGTNFIEFPAHSLTPDTVNIGGFGNIDPTNINNLAGKYRAQFGTPFDLSELNGIAGLNINAISHIKLIDVVGSIDHNYTATDTAGNLIIDPYPTPFATGGFDLDALGLIHVNLPSGIDNPEDALLNIYPNPCKHSITIETNNTQGIIHLISSLGQEVNTIQKEGMSITIPILNLPNGIYHVVLEEGNVIKRAKIVKH